MKTTRRSTIAGALGLFGISQVPKVATAAETGLKAVIPAAAPVFSFFGPGSPIPPCRISGLTLAEKAEYARVFRWKVEQDTYDAGSALGTARAWYRAHPKMVTASDPPEMFEWAMIKRGEQGVDDRNMIYDMGPADSGFGEQCREFAEDFVLRHVRTASR